MAWFPSLPVCLLLALCSNIVLLLLLILQLRTGILDNSGMTTICDVKTVIQDDVKQQGLDFSSEIPFDNSLEVKAKLNNVFVGNLNAASRYHRNAIENSIVNTSNKQLKKLMDIMSRKNILNRKESESASYVKSLLRNEIERQLLITQITPNVFTPRKSQLRSIHEGTVNSESNIRLRRKRGTENGEKSQESEDITDVLTLVDEVFSVLKANKSLHFAPPISDVLIPTIVKFGTLVLGHLKSLRQVIVGHDFRMEVLEKSMLSRKSDEENNSSALDLQGWVTMETVEGSGEVDMDIISTTSPTTTKKVMSSKNYKKMHRRLQKLEQKIMALESYNVMSDNELIRTRAEVIKMDDKVTEFNRKQRNLMVRTSMQTYRISELETFMAKTELAVTTSLEAFTASKERLDTFKDRLGQYSRKLEEVGQEFEIQHQISEELRAADTYKAHDINGIRGSLLALERRLNDLYRTLDQNVDNMRTDVRMMVERVCTNNFLSC